MLLQPIKQAINGVEFEFRGDVSSASTLAHLEKELLPICNACRSYMFAISWPRNYTDTSAVQNTIKTILQFGPIDGCSEVLFNLCSKSSQYLYQYLPTEIPVMSIVNWLNRGPNSDTINANEQVKKERIFEINSPSIPNLLALVNGLKKVNLNNLGHKK